jgi:hypothetical protein
MTRIGPTQHVTPNKDPIDPKGPEENPPQSNKKSHTPEFAQPPTVVRTQTDNATHQIIFIVAADYDPHDRVTLNFTASQRPSGILEIPMPPTPPRGKSLVGEIPV